MSRLEKIKQQETQRAKRVRAKISGTAERPRLSVSISNRHITAQLVDDFNSKTLVYVSTVGKKIPVEATMTEKAKDLGLELSKKAKLAKIKLVVLDRGSHLYHGRIKALAEAAREGGLEF